MAIEDIIQIKESVKENPMGDEQNINQAEFLRFLDEMGLGMDGVMAKIIQMFVEAPSDFTRKFGVEAAESVREFLDLTTQKELEEQGKVFAPNSAEIIGQNIDYTPDQSAIGTLQTDQADESEQMMKFLQDQIGPRPLLRAAKKEAETQYDVDKLNKYVEEQLNAEPGTYRVLSDEEVEVLGYPTKDGQIYEMDEVTNDVRLKEPGLIEGGLLKLLDWFKYGTTDRESR
jgi:hypothetical protein